MKNLKSFILKSNLFKLTFKSFSKNTFSFKNKLNLFYKHVHPDILGSTCPNEFRKINESSVQDLNNYIDSLTKINSKFENKLIDFYIKIEGQEDSKTNISFTKISINLEKIEPSQPDSSKINLQLK
jgi:hypothetical protein